MQYAQTITFGYSNTEDRLWIRLSNDDEAVLIWLTRRMAKGWLEKMPRLLENSCPGDLPGLSLDAATRVALEHEAALQMIPPTSSDFAEEHSPQAMSRKPENIGLLMDLNLTAHNPQFILQFTASSGDPVRLGCARTEAHQILSVLYRQTCNCGWDIPVCRWLMTTSD